ncbi:hypothetical protein MalM25_19790 [Planctomycetes bacterium MalM25]|nr:hypothetical protein MalM25_19790 [Planctomycetes bacterium MalM25]
MLVVMLLGLMAGVAAPRYQAAGDDAALRTAAKRLVADLCHARQQARTRAEEVGLEFLPASRLYQSLQTGYGVIADADHPGGRLIVNLDSRVTISAVDFGGAESIAFNFRGDPVSPGGVSLTDGRRTIRVMVNPLGEVVVSP